MNSSEVELSRAEQRVMQALGDGTYTVEELAAKAGYEVSGHFRRIVQRLRKRGILGNNQPGYFVRQQYRYLLER